MNYLCCVGESMQRIAGSGSNSRRSFLTGALRLTSNVFATGLEAEVAEALVGLNFTQAELDAACSQGQWAPDRSRF